MGKYSLENYERYKTVKIRPEPPEEADVHGGLITYVGGFWKELEPERGAYRLERLLEAIRSAEKPVLALSSEAPDWTGDDEADSYCELIRKVGSVVEADGRLYGVQITTETDSTEEWNAYIEAFGTTTLFADLRQEELIRHLRERDREFGLRIVCGEDNWLSCCEAIARQRLSEVWKRKPVLLHVADPECGPNVRREARRWHAALSNRDAGLGWNAGLRRFTYPSTVASGGSLPVRLWLVNTGTSPVYEDLELKLRLVRRDGGDGYEVPLQARTSEWTVGDIVHNEIAALPDMPEGVYSVGIGLFDKEGRPVRLSVRGDQADGYYAAGEVNVERIDGDPLANAWDTYYPEGYYPLEDPQAPQTEQ